MNAIRYTDNLFLIVLVPTLEVITCKKSNKILRKQLLENANISPAMVNDGPKANNCLGRRKRYGRHLSYIL